MTRDLLEYSIKSRTEVKIKATLKTGINTTTKDFCICFWLFGDPKSKVLAHRVYSVPSGTVPVLDMSRDLRQSRRLECGRPRRYKASGLLCPRCSKSKGGRVNSEKEELHTGF